MSYLNSTRLHFAGTFQVNVSTVNNDTGHFDTGAFKPSYQKMQGPRMVPPNGWFNPTGDAAWRLLGCQVTGAVGQEGVDTALVGCGVADADARVCAKMVDLDPQQQMVSEIWGLEVRIQDAAGNTALRADFEVTGFMDIWSRATGAGGGDNGACAAYQSNLVNLRWGDVSFSKVLTALQAASAQNGRLSIKFNLDGVNLDYTSPRFMCGRIVGTIGPVVGAEPVRVLLGRQFMAAGDWSGFFVPAGKINFFPGLVDETSSTLFLDLGNALPTVQAGGVLANLGDLSATAGGIGLGTLPASAYSTSVDWYLNTAGVVAFPLDAAQLQALKSSPISIAGDTGVSIAETPTGTFVRADRFVYRLSPGEVALVDVYATAFGQPLAGAALEFAFDPSQLQGGSMCQPRDCPNPGTPEDASQGAPTFTPTATTDASGKATLRIEAGQLGNVRVFKDGSSVDGQVYGIRPTFSDATQNGPASQENFANFVSVLAFSVFEAGTPVTWEDIQPTLKQYANLYPVMLNFLDLGSYESVIAHRRILQLAFGLDVSDPNSMPVTRDLSPAKRAAILSWLAHPLPPVVKPSAPSAVAVDAFAQVGEDTTESLGLAMDATPVSEAATLLANAPRGGKAAALAGRLGRSVRATARRARPGVRIRLATAAADASPVDVVCGLLQQAVELEHSTIPVYLYGLYSLDASKNAAIAEILQSIVVEEMLHMTLAANVLNALGGSPVVNSPGFIPTYPGHLPGGVDASLTVHLRAFSMSQLETYLDIEQPEDPLEFGTTPPPSEGMSIGQFYAHIEDLIRALGDGAFVPGPRNQIGPDQMRNAVVVTDVATAIQALQTIVTQGEGTANTPSEVVGEQYAHYYRFMEIQQGRQLRRVSTTGPVEQQYTYSGPPVPFDPTGVYAVPDDPAAAKYAPGTAQRNLCDRFNYTYTTLLTSLHQTLNGDAAALDRAIGVMMSLKGQAMQMMSGTPNPAALSGPSFEYQPTDPAAWPPT